MALAYAAALRMNEQPQAVQQTQGQWLKKRNQCSDIACVKAHYLSRLTSLPLAGPFTVIEDEVTSNDSVTKGFCQTMADNVNSMPSWPPAYCERPLNPTFTKLTLPQWREWTVEEFDKRWYLLEQAVNDDNRKTYARRDERWTEADTKRWREGIRSKESFIEETILPEDTQSRFESRRLLRFNSTRSRASLESFKRYLQKGSGKTLDISEYPNHCIPGAAKPLSDDGLAVKTNAHGVGATAPRWQLWLYEIEPGKYELFDQYWTWVVPGFQTGVLTHDADTCKILYIKPNHIPGLKK